MALRDVWDKLRNRLPSASLFIAERLAAGTSQRMIEKAPTKKIKEAISVKSVERSGTGIVATIEIDLKKAPEARAYEYGSGIHSDAGETYVILPRKGRALAFFWDKANPSIPRLPDGRVLLPKVNHPGVPAQPYVEPSLDELRKGARAVIAKQIKLEISAAFREAARE